jgi:hypothetical protein
MSSVSGPLTAVPPLTFKTKAEYEQWSAKFDAEMAQYSVGPVLDLKACHLQYAYGIPPYISS